MPLSSEVEWKYFVFPLMFLEPLKTLMFYLSGGWQIHPVGGMRCQNFPPSMKEDWTVFKQSTKHNQREQYHRDYKYQQGRNTVLITDLHKMHLLQKRHTPQHHHWVFYVLGEVCFKTGSVNRNWEGLQSNPCTMYGKWGVSAKGVNIWGLRRQQ